MSTVPIVRHIKEPKTKPSKPLVRDLSVPQDSSDSSSSESDSQPMFMEFNSSDSDCAESLTTKSSKRPMIVEVASHDFDEESKDDGNCGGSSEAARMKLKQANLRRR